MRSIKVPVLLSRYLNLCYGYKLCVVCDISCVIYFITTAFVYDII